MNKTLIKKYKTEFDYWLCGGTLCWMNSSDKAWFPVTGATWEISEPYDKRILIVINDKYVEFRKALVEGKTVQANVNYWAFPAIDEPKWQDIISQDSFKKFNLENIRILPEEKYEFKVGEYVLTEDEHLCEITKDNGNSYEVHNYTLGYKENYIHNVLEHWIPEIGDLCWFSDSLDAEPVFSRFTSILYTDCKKSKVAWYYADHSDYNGKNYYKHCQPFIGVLPKGFNDGK